MGTAALDPRISTKRNANPKVGRGWREREKVFYKDWHEILMLELITARTDKLKYSRRLLCNVRTVCSFSGLNPLCPESRDVGKVYLFNQRPILYSRGRAYSRQQEIQNKGLLFDNSLHSLTTQHQAPCPRNGSLFYKPKPNIFRFLPSLLFLS